MIKIYQCETARQWIAAKKVTQEYVEWLGIDLSFQYFKKEMETFEKEYGPPKGCFMIAMIDTRLAGGVGLRKFRQGICEMKRLYVRREFRDLGIGYQLCRLVVEKARTIGYTSMRLDTLERLKEANRLYTRMGFEKIPPYRVNPKPGARFMEYIL